MKDMPTAPAPLPSAPSDAPPPADDRGAAASPPNTNRVEGVGGDAGAPPPPGAKSKRKRNQLSAGEKVDSALAGVEGVRAVAALLRAAVGPVAAAGADPIVAHRIARCLEYSVERLEGCASAVEAACSNTPAKKSADRAHRKLTAEARQRQRGERLLVRGVGDADDGDVLRYALEDAEATFARLPRQLSRRPLQPVVKIHGKKANDEGEKKQKQNAADSDLEDSETEVNSDWSEDDFKGSKPVSKASPAPQKASRKVDKPKSKCESVLRDTGDENDSSVQLKRSTSTSKPSPKAKTTRKQSPAKAKKSRSKHKKAESSPKSTASRATGTRIPPADVDLPPPPDGNQLYSFNQAMNIIRDSSHSRRAVIDEMIRRKLVPLKRAMMFRHAKKHVGDGKPEAPAHWPARGSGQEIMSVGDLKQQLLLRRSQRTADRWRREDTAKALLDAKLAECARKGVDASCVKPPAVETVNAYHSALMSDPEIVRLGGAYKSHHQ